MADNDPKPTAPKAAKFKSPKADALGKFREMARGTQEPTDAQREPSAVIILDVGQYITGIVERTGTYFNSEFGNAAVLVFSPDAQDTNVAVAADGEHVDQLAPDVRYVFVCLGTMLRHGTNVAPGDLVHIERHEDTPNRDPNLDPYRTYTAVAQRGNRSGIKSFDELSPPPDTSPRFNMADLETPL